MLASLIAPSKNTLKRRIDNVSPYFGSYLFTNKSNTSLSVFIRRFDKNWALRKMWTIFFLVRHMFQKRILWIPWIASQVMIFWKTVTHIYLTCTDNFGLTTACFQFYFGYAFNFVYGVISQVSRLMMLNLKSIFIYVYVHFTVLVLRYY